MVLQAIEVPPSYLSAGGQRVSPVLLAGLYGEGLLQPEGYIS